MLSSSTDMRVFFSGVGGVGIGPLALIAQDAGFDVIGTSSVANSITHELSEHGLDIEYQTSDAHLEAEHFIEPIDWLVHSSAIADDHPELVFARQHGIRVTKRDAFINELLRSHSLQMVAIAGSHGKTTTTAMVTWLFKELGEPVSYSIGSQIPFGAIGQYDKESQYFVYECDEYDRNFLHFHPYMSLITSVDYDHPDSYPTPQDYDQAFQTFAEQSEWLTYWKTDQSLFGDRTDSVTVLDESAPEIGKITLPGLHNRQNAWQAIAAVSELTETPVDKLIEIINRFPGTARRFEKLEENIYTDYAHHPAEIAATLQLAAEVNPQIVAVYQPHQNTRQHAVADEYKDCFKLAQKVYWAPTYLTREDTSLPTLSQEELIAKLSTNNAEPVDLNDDLADVLAAAAANGKLVVILGAGPIDDWARENFSE